ncbi:hypothetical protein A4G99_05385 [Haladaptatus sp. R4]|uniref:hypothetical protein n=1 Tax=Haladaptatus sp. R4 TaxID=1679489 RepID=UPI0007B4E2A6|nr:hypothetical protein [Haladaptatus sp. R4]KZN25847.1 hypothetical protein A4G99_05385 [Haladaptatus sp. R4]
MTEGNESSMQNLSRLTTLGLLMGMVILAIYSAVSGRDVSTTLAYFLMATVIVYGAHQVLDDRSVPAIASALALWVGGIYGIIVTYHGMDIGDNYAVLGLLAVGVILTYRDKNLLTK